MTDILKKFYKCSPLFASKVIIWYKAERNKLDGGGVFSFPPKNPSKTTHKLQKGVLHENAGRFLYKC